MSRLPTSIGAGVMDGDDQQPHKLASVFSAQGDMFYKQQQYQKAANAYAKALEMDAEDASLLCKRSKCFLALEMHESALIDAELATQCDASSAEAHACMSEALANLGSVEEAIHSIKEALKHDRGNSKYHTKLEAYRQALFEGLPVHSGADRPQFTDMSPEDFNPMISVSQAGDQQQQQQQLNEEDFIARGDLTARGSGGVSGSAPGTSGSLTARGGKSASASSQSLRRPVSESLITPRTAAMGSTRDSLSVLFTDLKHTLLLKDSDDYIVQLAEDTKRLAKSAANAQKRASIPSISSTSFPYQHPPAHLAHPSAQRPIPVAIRPISGPVSSTRPFSAPKPSSSSVSISEPATVSGNPLQPVGALQRKRPTSKPQPSRSQSSMGAYGSAALDDIREDESNLSNENLDDDDLIIQAALKAAGGQMILKSGRSSLKFTSELPQVQAPYSYPHAEHVPSSQYEPMTSRDGLITPRAPLFARPPSGSLTDRSGVAAPRRRTVVSAYTRSTTSSHAPPPRQPSRAGSATGRATSRLSSYSAPVVPMMSFKPPVVARGPPKLKFQPEDERPQSFREFLRDHIKPVLDEVNSKYTDPVTRRKAEADIRKKMFGVAFS